MPEVVEVCLTALWLNEKLAGKSITKLTVLGGRYSRHTLSGLGYINSHKPFVVNKVDSKGKFLWFETLGANNKFYYILNRFGLEGEWGFTKEVHSGLQFTIKDNGEESELYFTDSRNFGTLEIVDDRQLLNNELNKLAPDVLKTEFTDKDLYDRITQYVTKGMDKINESRGDKEIYKVLMDQSVLYSGLGNYLSVEVLYNCKISPHKKISEIYKNKDLVNALAHAIKYTVKLSFMNANMGYLEHLDSGMSSFIKRLREDVNNNIDHAHNYHKDIALSDKDVFSFRVYRQKKDSLGNEVLADKIIKGRTTYWVPSVQK